MRQVSCLDSQKRVDPVKRFRKRHGNDPAEWCGTFGIRLQAPTHPSFTCAIQDRFGFRNQIRGVWYVSNFSSAVSTRLTARGIEDALGPRFGSFASVHGRPRRSVMRRRSRQARRGLSRTVRRRFHSFGWGRVIFVLASISLLLTAAFRC